jgi:basic membrane protein A and related proteins
MDRRSFQRALLATLAGAALPGLPARAAGEPLKVGFIYVGPIGDLGWSYAHDLSRRQAQAHFGSAITTSYVESVAEGPDSEGVLEDLVAKGHRLIFATSFGYMNYVLKVARRHPEALFEHCTGFRRATNLATYNIRFYQGRFVQGVIAAHMSRSGVAGYVASLPIPEVVQGMNAFLLGMRSVNPGARLKFILVNSWYDPPREGDAARALIDQGCDVITQHTDSPAPLQAAAGRGIPGFGEATDMAHFAPQTQLTANLNSWGPYYIRRIQAVLSNSWKSEDTWGGFESQMLLLAPFANMPAGVKSAAQQAEAQIAAGQNRVFRGPLVAQDGSTKAPAGVILDDQALASMQWLLQGIEGKLA